MSSLLVVSLFLAIEAVHRGWLMYLEMNGVDDLIEPIDGKLMSLTAGIGVIVNLALAAILGEHHVHLPGFDDHDHDHSHDHAHDSFKDQAQEQHSHDHSHASSNYHAIDDHSHDHSRHANSDDHSHDHSHANSDDHSHDHSHANSDDHSHDDSHANSDDHSHDHSHAMPDDHSHDHSHVMPDDHSHDHCHDEVVNQTQDDHSHNNFHENSVDLDHSHHHLSVNGSVSNSDLDGTDISYESEKSPLLNGKSHDEEQGHPKHVESSEEKERNINLHAAYVHVLSDLVQSVFVLVSGLAIWHDASWQFMDPICTIGFCIIVTKSSFGVILNSIKLLMNTTPPDVEWRSVYEYYCASTMVHFKMGHSK
jgi:Co/Zn/Cd efflux system component